MPVKNRKEKTTINARRAASILFPIAAFLRSGGMTPETAVRVFSNVFKEVSELSGCRKLEHIGHPTRYTDIVGMWMRSKRFIDKTGRPRMLRIEGRDGFNALVRSVTWQADPKTVLARFGGGGRTVRGSRHGRGDNRGCTNSPAGHFMRSRTSGARPSRRS